MAKEKKAAEEHPLAYGDVVQRLEETVAKLEGGSLSLEESLKAFEEGIRLVRQGERLLNAAEQRIEELLNEEGREVSAPLQTGGGRQTPASPGRSSASRTPTPAAEDDVPF